MLLPERVMMFVVEPREPSEFSIRAMREDAELADRVDGRLKDEPAVHSVEVIRAINQKLSDSGRWPLTA